MKKLLHIFNVSHTPLFKAASALSTEIMTISRLKHKPDLIKIDSVFPLPSIPSQFTKTFEEVVLKKAQQLWLDHSNNQNILWSGGIDSTVALIGLLRTRPDQAYVTVYCNINSIYENTVLYQKLLTDPYIKLKNSSVLNEPAPVTFITGDLGDQIFGSELLFRIIREFGIDHLKANYDDVVPKLFNSRCGEKYGSFLYDRYLPIVEECPFKIKSVFDYIWWWNYSQKWQAVKLRKRCYVDMPHQFISFFDSVDFELWSIFNHDKKIGITSESYKQIAKDFIFEFDGNEKYRSSKKKCSSYFGGKLTVWDFLTMTPRSTG